MVKISGHCANKQNPPRIKRWRCNPISPSRNGARLLALLCRRPFRSGYPLVQAEQLSPQDSSSSARSGNRFQAQGVWQRCLEYFARAREIDPLNTKLLADNAEVLAALRQFPGTLKACDKILDMIPNDPSALAGKNRRLPGARRSRSCRRAACAAGSGAGLPVIFAKTNQLIYERRYQEAVAALQNAPRKPGCN